MPMIKCPECNNEYDNVKKMCPNCGCPTDFVQANTKNSAVKKDNFSKIRYLRRIKNYFLVASVICFLVAYIFFSKANNVKNNYHNSDSYFSVSENAYVGGDAYNYIINGTYFTGYSVIGSALVICGSLFIISMAHVSIKIKMYQ